VKTMDGGSAVNGGVNGASPLLVLVLQMLSDRALADGADLPPAFVAGVLELVAAGKHSPAYVSPLLPFFDQVHQTAYIHIRLGLVLTYIHAHSLYLADLPPRLCLRRI